MSRQTPPHQQLSHHVAHLAHAAILAALALSAVACAKDVPTGAQPCPCADGYVCCKSGICAQGQDACDEATSALSARAVGRWTGYLENYKELASGSDTLSLSFSLATDGSLQGTVKFGDAAPPAPATDPKAPWPPGTTQEKAEMFLGRPPIEGFAYSAHAINWEARRLKLDAYFAEPWKPWCELQTPYTDSVAVVPSTDGGTSTTPVWLCGPSGYSGRGTTCEFSDTSGNIETISCAVASLCMLGRNLCPCTSTGCTSADPATSPYTPIASFDIALSGDSGDGSVVLPDGMHNVRLVRASH